MTSRGFFRSGMWSRRRRSQRVECIENRKLPAQKFFPRLCFGKPSRAIDLGKLLRPSRFRRPLERKKVARDAGGVAVALDGPSQNDLSAWLLEFSDKMKFAVGRK